MAKENIIQEINNCIELRKNLWTAFIILTGGLISLILNVDNFIKLILIIIGSIVWIALIYSVSLINKEIKFYIKQLIV